MCVWVKIFLSLVVCGSFLGTVGGPGSVQAQAMILLEEILPVLKGSELGHVEVLGAPHPGSERFVRRHEVIRALHNAGYSEQELSDAGLKIPKSIKISRIARVLNQQEIASLIYERVSDELAPCELQKLHLPPSVKIAQGRTENLQPTIELQLQQRKQSGRVSGLVTLESGGFPTRFSVRASVTCPAPVLLPGGQVQIVATVGNVRASAPGEVRQPGRVGDLIRVRNSATQVLLWARVLDSSTVEVIQ